MTRYSIIFIDLFEGNHLFGERKRIIISYIWHLFHISDNWSRRRKNQCANWSRENIACFDISRPKMCASIQKRNADLPFACNISTVCVQIASFFRGSQYFFSDRINDSFVFASINSLSNTVRINEIIADEMWSENIAADNKIVFIKFFL